MDAEWLQNSKWLKSVLFLALTYFSVSGDTPICSPHFDKYVHNITTYQYVHHILTVIYHLPTSLVLFTHSLIDTCEFAQVRLNYTMN